MGSEMCIRDRPNPPFPRNDIEQRANMGRNTMRKQLERALQSQREYETKNAEKLQQARDLRNAELEKRAAEKRKAEEAIEEQRRKIAEERKKLRERDLELAAKKADEERKKKEADEADLSIDEETGEKKKRTRKGGSKRKKKNEEVEDGTDAEASGAENSEQVERPRTKRRESLRDVVYNERTANSNLVRESLIRTLVTMMSR